MVDMPEQQITPYGGKLRNGMTFSADIAHYQRYEVLNLRIYDRDGKPLSASHGGQGSFESMEEARTAAREEAEFRSKNL